MGDLSSSEGFHLRFLDGCPEIPPVPANDQVQQEFDEFLSSKCVEFDLQVELNATESLKSKWAYVFLSKVHRDNDTEEWLGPHECVGLIQRLHTDAKCVRDLFFVIRLNALLRPSTWAEAFLAEKGAEAVMTPLQTSAVPSVETSNEVISTLLVLTNSSSGISSLLEVPDCCHRICAIFNSSSSNETKARSLNLLRILCRDESAANDTVLSGFSSNGTKARSLQHLVATLEQNQPDLALQIVAIKFVNAFLESVRDKKKRATICDDLKEHGFLALLEPYLNRNERAEPNDSATTAMIVQAQTFFDYCGESNKDDKFGALRLALGDAFNSARGSTPTRSDCLATNSSSGNQGENEDKPELDDGAVVGCDTTTDNEQTSGNQTRSLEHILGQLQLHTKKLDQTTNDKLTELLQKIALTLTNEAGASEAVDRLSKSLSLTFKAVENSSHLEEKTPAPVSTAEGKPAHEQDFLTRVGLALFPSLGDSTSAAKPPTSGRPTLFSGFSDFSLSNLTATTPAKSSVSRPSFSSFIGADGAASPWGRSTDSSGSGSLKLSLPFFQSSRKGPGLGVTPACTPIATASVRKDAKRLVFPSMPSPQARKEVPTVFKPAVEMSSTTTTPLPPPSLPPINITPAVASQEVGKPLVIEQGTRSNSSVRTSTGTDISKFRKLLSMGAPREAVRAKMQQAGINPDLLDEQQGFSPNVSLRPAQTVEKGISSATREIDDGPDVSKFRKLLSMGAPLAAVQAKMCQAGLDPELLNQNAAAEGAKEAASVPRPPETPSGPDITKFKKLLSMGAPLAAVKAKMTQAGLDPSLLDNPSPAGIPAPVAPPSVPVGQSKTYVKDDPNYAKFFKLLAMGAPAAAVKAKMVQAGLNSDLLDTPDAEMPSTNSSSSSQDQAAAINPAAAHSNLFASREPSQPQAETKVKDNPQYAKFFKLLSMGAPAASVKAKMQMAGLQPELLDTPDAALKPTSTATEAPAPQSEVKVKDDPSYSKFFKLLSMGAPPDSVKAKMQMAGLKPDLLDTPDAPMPNAPMEAAITAVKVKDDPAYTKFFKLLSMGAPAESVKMKLQMAGLKPELLDTPDAILPDANSQTPAQSQVKVRDDPAYAKFFKLLEMGAPAESVKAKMSMAGLQGDLLDTPDAILPSPAHVTQSAAPAPTSTAARRAHLSIAIKPVSKAKTRAFYWQHLKGEAIAGTIWEELEKEQSNQSNQDFLTLTESELELLETEFPPPVASGPSTGTRRGSIIGSPAAGPGSPLASPRVVFLIDRARSNNISIIVKQFRISNAALRVAIMKMDSEVLTLERVQGLIKILPTEEEIAAITGFHGDPTTLNGAELVLKEIISVPRLRQRLSALETKHQFPALVRDLQTKVNKIRTASNDIAQCFEFKIVLLVILQIGNKMNHGTPRGAAKGFRLNDLTKLVQLKSVERSVTLLHYVARMVRMKKDNVVRLGDSLASLYDVQNIPIPELLGDMSRISDLTESINVELAAQRLKNRIEEKEEIDLFVESMTEFVETAAKAVTSVKQELDDTLKLMRETMLRFDKNTESDDTLSPPPAADDQVTPANLAKAGEFFSIIYEFTMSLMKADRENELKRIREEKRQKQQELKNATPRRNSVKEPLDRAALSKLCGVSEKATGPEAQEAPRRKSMIAMPSSAALESKGVCSLLPGTHNNLTSAKHEVIANATAKSVPATPAADANISDPETSNLIKSPLSKEIQPSQQDNEVRPPQKISMTVDIAKLKPTGIPKAPLKTPSKIVKSSASTSVASPLKKPTEITAIPSPMKLQRRTSSAPSIEKSKLKALSTETADAASIREIKSQLETKHAANNDPQSSRTLKPEVEAEGSDHDNNNSEPNSPEKALSEAEPSTRVAIQSDAYIQVLKQN